MDCAIATGLAKAFHAVQYLAYLARQCPQVPSFRGADLGSAIGFCRKGLVGGDILTPISSFRMLYDVTHDDEYGCGRRGGVNLLGGRARTRHFHPLTLHELGPHFDLHRAIERGLLPSIYFSDDPKADLEAYTGTYLQQEIVAEGATRSVPAFSRFLRVAAFCNATVVNFTNLANDAQVPRTTVYEYMEILRDTLVIHEIPAWRHSKKAQTPGDVQVLLLRCRRGVRPPRPSRSTADA